MNTINGTWKNGQIVLDKEADWPEGQRLLVEPEQRSEDKTEHDDDGPMTSEEIAQILAAMDKIEPFDLTDGEARDLSDWEEKVKQYTIATMDKGIEDVFR